MKRIGGILSLVLAVRLLALLLAPLELSPDEAYYWDWSRRLAWGYYSKPPMAAWMIALSTRLFGTSALSVRLPAALLGLAGTAMVYGLGRRMYGPRVGIWSAVAWAACPIGVGLGFIMTIDAPFVCFWCVALLLFWRATRTPGPVAWTAAACAVGLGLLSKQMMAAFLVLSFCFLGAHAKGRTLLRRSEPYIFGTLALLFFLPVLLWNAGHDWITFTHTAHHFAGNRTMLGFLETAPTFLGSQLLIVSPLLALLLALLSWPLARRLRLQDDRARFLLCFGAVPLALFVLMSLRQRINANWAVACYPAGFVLLAAWGCGALSTQTRWDGRRRLFFRGVRLAVILSLLAYAAPFVPALFGVEGGRLDPGARARGWTALGSELDQIRRQQPDPRHTFLVAPSRQEASELAFYSPGRPPVYLWPDKSARPLSQYDLWPGPPPGWDALFLLAPGQGLAADVGSAFRSVTRLKDLRVQIGQAGSRAFSLYRASGLVAWPK